MSKRGINCILGTISLAFGGLIYILFRNGSYISYFFDECVFVMKFREILVPYESELLKYYLGDFLWCFSLGCFLQMVFGPKGFGSIFCSAVAAICGAVWELMQYVQLISGTADLLDILMYLSAGILCTIINLKERKL